MQPVVKKKYWERTLADRLWAKVDSSAGESACWPWAAYTNGDGYGIIGIGGHKSIRAHRVAWEVTNGPIPAGQQVCHRCDNRRCCNPAHLFLGANDDNMRDMIGKGRAWWADPAKLLAHVHRTVERAPRLIRAKNGQVIAALRARVETETKMGEKV